MQSEVHYPLITRTTVEIAASVLTGRRRDFLADSRRLVASLRPAPVIEASPPDLTHGHWIVVANHLHSQTFRAWWIALTITAALDASVHWIMTDAWQYPRGLAHYTLEPGIHWVLSRLARGYGFTSMPPMPPRPWEAAARARAVLGAVRFAEGHPDTIVGLVPEGGDSVDGRMMAPPSGVGRFLQLLTRSGRQILPVGLFESGAQLHLHFGEAFSIPVGISAGDRDHRAAEACMRAIAECVPPELRGAYA